MNVFSKLVNWYFKRKSLPYWCVFIIDALVCYLSGIAVSFLFFKAHVVLGNIVPITHSLLLYMVVNVFCFKLFHTYAGIIRYSSFIDLQRIVYAMGTAFLCVALIHYSILFWDKNTMFFPFHLRHIVSVYLMSIACLWAFRIVIKLLYDTMFDNVYAKRVLIFGVKQGGIGLAKYINTQKPQRFRLKGFISPEKQLSGKYLMSQRVYLPQADIIENVIESQHIHGILVSPLFNDFFRKNKLLVDMLINKHVAIYMTSDMAEWNEKKQSQVASSMREINVVDLLPRSPIEIDLEEVKQALQGKCVMITGAAGSIGKEIVKQVAMFNPANMVLIDQAETPQHDVRLMMKIHYPKIKAETFVASITNGERIEKIFATYKPHYVFHAAAYKHVPMMEDNPSESIQNNIWGTKVIADLSVKYGVEKFVMISTDKAVNPTNVMGCSKRICEMYVQSLDKAIKEKQIQGQTQFVTTRFGNVLGSNGSVIPLFERQIKAGGPITVTDPNIIRYFMLIPEACKLVLEAGTKGKGGEIFVFDMGEPVKIAELAKRMIQLSGAENVEIVYTGLRAGEKLYEEVLNNEENTLPSFNAKIRIAQVREYTYAHVNKDIENLMAVARSYDNMEMVRKMKQIVPEYKSKNSVYSVLD